MTFSVLLTIHSDEDFRLKARLGIPSYFQASRQLNHTHGGPCGFQQLQSFSCDNISKHVACPDLKFDVMTGLCATEYGQSQLQAQLADGFDDRYQQVSDGTGIILEAFVTFVTGDKYADLATYALRGAMEFTNQAVVLYVGGRLNHPPQLRWPTHSFPRLVVFHMPAATMHPWFDKLRTILMSPVKHGAILEADSLPTWHSGRVFQMLAENADITHPLLPVHQDARLASCSGYTGTSACVNTYPYPDDRRSMHYMHAHVFWTAQAKEFVSAVLQTCATGARLFVGQLDCASDEVALNTALWNTNATKQLALIPGWDAFPAWEHQRWDDVPRAETFKHRHVVYIYVHGHKDPAVQEDFLKRIKAIGKHAAWWYGPAPGGSEQEGPFLWSNDTQLLLQAVSSTGYLI
jgi:hypothetical protein